MNQVVVSQKIIITKLMKLESHHHHHRHPFALISTFSSPITSLNSQVVHKSVVNSSINLITPDWTLHTLAITLILSKAAAVEESSRKFNDLCVFDAFLGRADERARGDLSMVTASSIFLLSLSPSSRLWSEIERNDDNSILKSRGVNHSLHFRSRKHSTELRHWIFSTFSSFSS